MSADISKLIYNHIIYGTNKAYIYKLIDESKYDINYADPKTNNTLLHIAIKYQYWGLIDIFVENDQIVNKINNNNETPLYLAITYDYFDIVKLLLKNGAKIINTQIKYIDLAIENRHLYMAKYLCRFEMINRYMRRETLIYAANDGFIESLKLAVSKSEDTNPENPNNIIAMLMAAENGHVKIVKYFLSIMCIIDSNNMYTKNALIWTIRHNYFDVFKMLYDNMSKNLTSIDYDFMLHFAIEFGHVDIIRHMIQNDSDDTYLYFMDAVDYEQYYVVKWFMQTGFIESEYIISEMCKKCTYEIQRLISHRTIPLPHNTSK